MDFEKLVKGFELILGELEPGRILDARRIAKGWLEMLDGYEIKPEQFTKLFEDSGKDQLVICRDIDFYSVCEHHLLPFFGKIHIGYIPRDKVMGLSKLPRLVNYLAHRLQMQERLTKELAYTLNKLLEPEGVGVIVEATHLCMKCRGVKSNAKLVTSEMLGEFRSSSSLRSEFLKLIGGSL